MVEISNDNLPVCVDMFLYMLDKNCSVIECAEKFDVKVSVVFNKLYNELRKYFPNLYECVEPLLIQTPLLKNLFDYTNSILEKKCTLENLAELKGANLKDVETYFMEFLPAIDFELYIKVKKVLEEEYKSKEKKRTNIIKEANKTETLDAEQVKIRDEIEAQMRLYIQFKSQKNTSISCKLSRNTLDERFSRYIAGEYGTPDISLVEQIELYLEKDVMIN